MTARVALGGPDVSHPSKNIIHSAKVAELHHRCPEFGLDLGSSAVAMTGVAARKRRMVEELVAIHLERYRESGADVILGEGRFVAAGTVEVQLEQEGTRRLRGDRVFLNLGTRASVPNLPGIEDARSAHTRRGACPRLAPFPFEIVSPEVVAEQPAGACLE
jgi:pyruvate/2-oxoglutarate dehydrogenase complex dihydrolipoamide dehydrogenase (E3) component